MMACSTTRLQNQASTTLNGPRTPWFNVFWRLALVPGRGIKVHVASALLKPTKKTQNTVLDLKYKNSYIVV
ncbi:hypothetical protein L596_001624 [Steinernema carpocapsae]|uniref:Uncharacterized protein n=1 Tax=Steinernema carpocapsae TaxID=34508 RepID=A0A4U8UM27_STECR|nr:hypothetical protein L596_001624 [Steinernema carpocapsae]